MRQEKELTTLWEKSEGKSSATGVAPANVSSEQPSQGNGADGIASNQSAVVSAAKDSENSARGKEPRESRAEGETQTPSEQEAELRDRLTDIMRDSGIEVSTDAAEGQRILDEYNEQARLSAAKKSAPETASVTSDEAHQPTVVSSADGAKVLEKLDTLAKECQENSNKSR